MTSHRDSESGRRQSPFPDGRFESLHIILGFLGSTFLLLSGILLIPLMIAILVGEITDLLIVKAFLIPVILSVFIGMSLKFFFHGGKPTSLHAMLICSLGWLGFSALGAVPYVIGLGVSYVDGFFEAMSGFTTTGITLFMGLDQMSRTILFWRSLTQWLGGLGILTFFLMITYRGSSAHQLFGAESHKIEVKRPVPGLLNTVRILWLIYGGFTLLIAIALWAAGMTPFDSICHSFTTLSTGGFSTHDASIGYYTMAGYAHGVIIQYIIILGMILGGMNFLVHYHVLKKNVRALWDTVEAKYWWGLIAGFVCIICVERMIGIRSLQIPGNPGMWAHIEETVRTVLFQVVAILTTTGFGTENISSPFFGEVARQLFLVMMVIGGCVGSTGGGFKVLRVIILGKLIGREVYQSRTPRRAVSLVVVDGNPVSSDEIQRVSGLFFMWIILIIIGGVVTAFLTNVGGYEALSGMFSAMGNIGPSFISVETMIYFNPVVKITYIVGMLAGRLEILPVLLLFSPKAWSPTRKMLRRW
ncbi:MAG: TrkH family potassium uptake protein [Theionarchaea archaeon]|nr:TrkH family potassium uptake protein [Theionarchaea archaeon]